MNEVMIVQIIYVFRDKEEDLPDTGELLALQQQYKDTIGGLLRHLKLRENVWINSLDLRVCFV